MPGLDWVLLAVACINLAASLATFAVPYSIIIKIEIALSAITVVLLFFTGFYSLYQGHRAARFYVVAFSFLLVGIFIYVLKTVDILPTNAFTEYSVLFGSAIEVILLSFALADRINIMQKEQAEERLQSIESKQEMVDSFARFVPGQFLNILGKESLVDIEIGEAIEKEITILFSDIRKFTLLSEGMSVNETFKFLNAYLGRMAPLIHGNHGFIDKFIGDAIMAIFPGKVEDAVNAAIDMALEVKIYNKHRKNSGYEPVSVGFGLNFGRLMLGTVGAADRIDTTVVGDTVNLASRIESFTKIFRTPILMADYVYRRIKRPEMYAIREIDSVRVKGKKNPVVLYEVYDADSEETRDGKEATIVPFQMAMVNYKAGNFEDSLELFSEVVQTNPHDTVAQSYIKRCHYLIENPPGPKWSGISRVK